MEKRTAPKHTIDYLCILLLLFLFIATGLMVIAVGTGIYQKITDRMNKGSNSRLVTAYFREKVHQSRAAGSIYLTDFDGKDTLALAEDIDGTRYVTYLYLSDGNLMELFTTEEAAKDGSLAASSGTSIMKLHSLSYEEVDPCGPGIDGANGSSTDSSSPDSLSSDPLSSDSLSSDSGTGSTGGETLILVHAVTEDDCEENFYLSALRGSGTSLIEDGGAR